MASAVTLSSKYQIVIPKEVREQAHLQAGDRLTFVVKGNVIHLVRLSEFATLRGSMVGADTTGVRDREDR